MPLKADHKADHKTDRQSVSRFDQIVNIGPAMSRDFERMGFKCPQELIGQDPVELYRKVCKVDQQFHDPCVLDVFIATVDYMNGNRPRQWWDYTGQRKRLFSNEVDQLRAKYPR